MQWYMYSMQPSSSQVSQYPCRAVILPPKNSPPRPEEGAETTVHETEVEAINSISQ